MTHTAPIPTTTDTYRERADLFGEVVAATPGHRWDDPSPCAGWSARDVLDHVVSTERDFLTEHGADLGAGTDPASGPDTDPASTWTRHADAVLAALASGLAERPYDGFFGPTSVGESIHTFYGFDLVVHRWDLARAAGLDTTWSNEEMDFVEAAADGFGDLMHSDAVCGPAVPVPDDAPRQDRLLGRLGRDPGWAPPT